MAIQTLLPVKAKRITYAEYRALPEDGNRYEVIQGGLIVTAAPKVEHQNVSANLQFVLETWLRANDWGKLFDAPIEVYLGAEDFIQPDLVCVSKARKSIIKENNIAGVPDLVVEILSFSTARYDRIHKANTFARHGVPHYWMLDPAPHTLEAFELEIGVYKLAAALSEDDVFEPTLFPRLKIPLGDLWK
ncbi:MAG: Uma2 family endonuclease [Chloroflexi bacterium]|nr:Uma2 family endonuclease [Chloroflexota bacterium]